MLQLLCNQIACNSRWLIVSGESVKD